MARYVAVAGQDVGTCEALRWQWSSIHPMVLTQGDDHDVVEAEAIEIAGHDEIHIHDREPGRLCDARTGETIGRATSAEAEASRRAAARDGGRGVIAVDGRSCYVEES